MTFVQLLAPIALATIVNAFLFALAWKGHQGERRTGTMSGWFYVALPLYGPPLLAFLYFDRGKALTRFYEALATAFLGEATGIIVVYTLLSAFLWSRGEPLRDRAFNIGLSVLLLAGLIAVAFQ